MLERKRLKRRGGLRWILAFGCALWIGCSDDKAVPSSNSDASGSRADVAEPSSSPVAEASDPSPKVPKTLSHEERVEAGRSVYNSNCIACHNVDPTKDGALGPAVAGSSLALIEARVLRSEYPEGYEPKRKTRVMVALPHLEPRLPELAAYLQSFD